MIVPTDRFVAEVTSFWTWMGDDGIVRTKVKPDSVITIVEARENSVAVAALSTGYFPLIVDARAIKSMSKEARSHFSLRDRESQVLGIAIIVESRLSRIIGNFFIGHNKSKVPTKIFTKEESAAQWAMQFLESKRSSQ